MNEICISPLSATYLSPCQTTVKCIYPLLGKFYGQKLQHVLFPSSFFPPFCSDLGLYSHYHVESLPRFRITPLLAFASQTIDLVPPPAPRGPYQKPRELFQLVLLVLDRQMTDRYLVLQDQADHSSLSK